MTDKDGPKTGNWSDLSQRMISGGLAAAGGLWLMWLGGVPFKLLVSAVVGIMVWEVARMLSAEKLSLPLGLLASLVMVTLALLPTGLALPLIFLPGLLGISQLHRYKVFGLLWMLWLALIVIVSDVLGYFAGRIIGGPKFWPKVSPKKTWSGTLAGWAGAALIGAWYLVSGYAGPEIIGISVAVAIAGQMGDVAESALKRAVGVKDSSSILPGHGGMFDRFDSMLGASLFLLVVSEIIDFPPLPL